MANHSSVSIKFSANLSSWINRCYSIHSTEGNFSAFMNDFATNLCTHEGIYGSWIFGQNSEGSGFSMISSFSQIGEAANELVIKSFLGKFNSLDTPWEVIAGKFRKSGLFASHSQTQPDNALSVCMLPGFNVNGKIILVVVAESELVDLLRDTLPGMFQNILEFSKLRYDNTDSIYRLLVENQNELVVKVDEKGHFLFVSPTYCKLFGMDASQLIGHGFEPLIHPDDREVTSEAMKKLEIYPHTCYVEQRAKTVLGWRWLAWSDKAILDRNGKISAIIGVGRDISEQKKIEKELIESELKFQKAFRNSPNLMTITRLSDGLIYDVNDKFMQLRDLPRDQIIGRSTSELGLFNAMPRSFIESTIKQKGKVEDVEFTITTAANQKLEGLFSSEIIELNGELCLVSSFNDITELKEAQRELDNYRIHLEGIVEQRTAKIREVNEELDRFAHSVSHDLKAPLRVMQGFANAILEDHSGDLDQEALDYLHRISSASIQMETLINDLLQYSRLTSLELDLKTVDPRKAIEKALELLSVEISSKKAKIRISDDIPMVRSYLPVLVQVFSNLISNSLKFVKNGIAPKVSIDGLMENGKILIRVKDNGIGIPQDKQKRIFDVFERLHGVESFQGSGIGLTIVKKAMARMGGEVHVKSSPGKGSTFTLVMQSS